MERLYVTFEVTLLQPNIHWEYTCLRKNVSRLRRLVEGARHAEKPLVFSIPGSGSVAISGR